MDSISKLNAKIEEYCGPPPADAEPMELMLRSAALGLAPMVRQVIPDDPEILDEAFAAIARQILGLRSDEAPVLALVLCGPDGPELIDGDAVEEQGELGPGE
jgi:hypothetical protein